ncbi:MAG: N-acetylneuraminate synthase family protein [Candidatus Paceibacterota bacterium]
MNIFDKIKQFLNGHPEKVKIGKKYVGPGEPVFVIAEVGINHNGDMEIAKKLIDVARDSGADAVKFQKRTTKEILTKEGLDKPYTSPNAFAPTYGAHRDALEFNEDQYRELKKYAEKNGVLFFASAWDKGSADFLESFDVDAYKVPSADTINIPLLEYIAKKNKPVLISTGMNTFDEIQDAVSTVLKHNNRVVVFHCLSLYPSPEHMIELAFMDTLKRTFHPLPVGYSGHEIDLLPTLAAVSRGAVIVERHLTLDKQMKGSDHAGSLEPHELKELVDSIRRIEKILGKGGKTMHEELKPLRDKLAKSVATKRVIKKGEVLTKDMFTIKGPGTGIKPRDMEKLYGLVAEKDLDEDVIVPVEALGWKK